MKQVVKDGMQGIFKKFLLEFRNEETPDKETIAHYAHKMVDEVERYLKAFKDFKED